MNNSLLTKENIEYAKALANKFGGTIKCDMHEKSITMDDLEQESLLGLCEAAERYDETLNIEFRTYAYIWCRKRVLEAKHKYGSPLSVSINHAEKVDLVHLELMQSDDDKPDEIVDPGSLSDALFYQMSMREEAEREADAALMARVERMLTGLSPKERQALVYLYGLRGQTELDGPEVAKLLGITPRRVNQIREGALRKLEACYN